MTNEGLLVPVLVKSMGIIMIFGLNYFRDGKNEETSYGFIA